MVTRSDSMSPLAFVAHQLGERRKTIKTRKENSPENDFAIQTSRTVSEEHSIINCCRYKNCARRSRWQIVPRLYVVQLVILSEAKNLRFFFYAFVKPTIRDASLSLNMTAGVKLLLFAKLDFLRQTAQGYARFWSKAQQPQRNPWLPLGSPC